MEERPGTAGTAVTSGLSRTRAPAERGYAREGRAARREEEEALWRLDRLGPLLRDLVAWDLVYRTESGSFLLREDVQRRLEEASARQARLAAPQVFVGRPCQGCGALGITRMVGTARLCSACSEVPAAGDPPTEQVPRSTAKHGRHGWTRKAG